MLRDGWYFTARPRLSRRGRRSLRRRASRRHDRDRRRERPSARSRVGLARCPGVTDVCVVGLPDDRWGQVVTAFIVRRDASLTEQAVIDYCLAANDLAAFKRPRRIHFVDEIPKSSVGKVQRRVLQEAAPSKPRSASREARAVRLPAGVGSRPRRRAARGRPVGAKALAGGQSLVPLMNLRRITPAVLVDISRCRESAGIRDEGDCLAIGALADLPALEDSELVRSTCGLLGAALRYVGSPAVRNRGTVGGSLSHADPNAELPTVVAALGGELTAPRPGRGAPASVRGLLHRPLFGRARRGRAGQRRAAAEADGGGRLWLRRGLATLLRARPRWPRQPCSSSTEGGCRLRGSR